MTLLRLLIKNFRNIEAADINLAPRLNIFVGANGSGKTSILEAIYSLGHGRSFRTVQANRVIQHGEDAFFLHGKIDEKVSTTIGLSKNRQGDAIIKINSTEGHKSAELAHLLPMQLVTPEGGVLLSGGPKFRRAFLDWGCFHSEVDFFLAWHRLNKLLKQRNAALRQAKHYSHIQHWDVQLVPLVQQVTAFRADYANVIAKKIITISELFLPEYTISCNFHQGWDKDKDYQEILIKQFDKDRMLTYTSLGPHKADLRIRVSGGAVEDVLSRGQLKLLMCAMRLAQGELLTTQFHRHCLYLVDDFASELDSEHRKLLLEQLKKTQTQVFLTAVSQDQFSDIIDEHCKVFQIEQGKIEFQS